MKVRYKSDHYNAINYYIHKLKFQSYWSGRHAINKKNNSIRVSL